jgi:hypothetical protein
MIRFQDLLCADDKRRADLRLNAGLYGIDFLEVRTAPAADNQRVLELHFQTKAADPGWDAFLNSLDGHPERFLKGSRRRCGHAHRRRPGVAHYARW